MELEIHHSFLISLIRAVLDGDPTARKLFESADFKAMVSHWEDHYRSELVQGGRAPSKSGGAHPDEIDPGDLMHLIVASAEEAKDALRSIQKWLKGAERISFCDPYIMHRKKSALFKSDEDYIHYVTGLLPRTARQVDFFGTSFSKKIKTSMLREAKEGRRVSFYDTNAIHDRYIIRDDNEGRMLGTSLGGFGNKLFTVLDLPAKDTKTLVSYLKEIRKEQSA